MKRTQSTALAEIVSRPIDDATRQRAAVHVRDWIACCSVGAMTDASRLEADCATTQTVGVCTTLSNSLAAALPQAGPMQQI